MIADSTVWIDYSNNRSFWQVERWESAIRSREAMVTDAVRLEVLAGLAPTWSGPSIPAALDLCEDVMQLHRIDAEEAASIYRGCRAHGETVRSLTDCLIAAIAIRNDVAVLHRDKDYDTIARYFPLQVVQP
ncbi:MAG TPA: PIN domain-containing protein [Jatrophihabitans sp.]|nr:PIN domain-containing protein [Jatrophihabitans sp.]